MAVTHAQDDDTCRVEIIDDQMGLIPMGANRRINLVPQACRTRISGKKIERRLKFIMIRVSLRKSEHLDTGEENCDRVVDGCTG